MEKQICLHSESFGCAAADVPYYARIVSEVSRRMWADTVEGFLRFMRSNKLYHRLSNTIVTAEPKLAESEGDTEAKKVDRLRQFNEDKLRFLAYQRLNSNGELTLRDQWLVGWFVHFIPDKIDKL